MEKHIIEACKRYGMQSAFGKVIIGFSGGADSSALLHYFLSKSKEVVCVHVNHMIRGEEATRDELFCSDVCKKYGVELVIKHIDIPKIAEEKKIGLEECARQERYKVLREEKEKRHFDAILTAHNANDNLESILFNLSRGTTISGLCGIKPVNDDILRPLIFVSREEILEYLDENGIDHIEDSTNKDTDYTRNYIRHEIIPKLKEINPKIVDAAKRMSSSLRYDDEYLNLEAREFISSSIDDGKIKVGLLDNLDRALVNRILRILSHKNLDYVSCNKCYEFIYNSKTSNVINLNEGISFKREKDYFCFVKTKDFDKVSFSHELNEGVNYIPEIDETIILEYGDKEKRKEAYSVIRLDKDKIKGELIARNKEDGDVIISGKMTKKIKRIFSDKNIPTQSRDKIPLICDDNGVIAIPNISQKDNTKGKDITLTFIKYEGDFSIC